MDIDKRIKKIIDSFDQRGNWDDDSRFLDIRLLSNDLTGDIGEILLRDIFTEHGYKVIFERGKTSDDKDWDIVIDDKTIEVKTATMGNKQNTFQHEKFFRNRNYDLVWFIDFAPDDMYMLIAQRLDIMWNNLHPRKVNGILTNEYKLDISLAQYKKLIGGDMNALKKLRNISVGCVKTEQDVIDMFEGFCRNIQHQQ